MYFEIKNYATLHVRNLKVVCSVVNYSANTELYFDLMEKQRKSNVITGTVFTFLLWKYLWHIGSLRTWSHAVIDCMILLEFSYWEKKKELEITMFFLDNGLFEGLIFQRNEINVFSCWLQMSLGRARLSCNILPTNSAKPQE